MVSFEENIDWEYQHKLEKYEDLQEQWVKNSWTTDIFLIEVKCQGFIVNSTSAYLTKHNLSPVEIMEMYPEALRSGKSYICMDPSISALGHKTNKVW